MGGYDLAMIHRVLPIGRWVVDFLFATIDYDIDGVLACLYDAGADGGIMDRAEEVMVSGDPNCGFTFTNPDRFRAVVVIGPTTGGSEYIDTLVHEIHHLSVAVASELGIDLESETPAYLAGDSARALAEVVCELGCPHCSASSSSRTYSMNLK